MHDRATAMVVLGTRPEAVKLAPLIRALRDAPDFRPVVVTTGQHREILDEVLELFEIVPEHDLGVHRQGQTLTYLTNSILQSLETLIGMESPQIVIVQGDTTTTLAASLAAFYAQVPVLHVEAGLRSGDRESPFPEELNRQLTSRIAQAHLCPTSRNRENLIREGLPPQSIFVTGNTVVDALQWVVANHLEDTRRKRAGATKILMTAHRRESWNGGLASVANGVADVISGRTDVELLFPIHPNPIVRDAIYPALGELPNVRIVEPLSYVEFIAAMAESHLVVSDSGGVQEEAPSIGVPVLVTRDNTERPEAIEKGTVRLVGTRRADVSKQLAEVLDDRIEYERMRHAVNPYGDGKASERGLSVMRHMLWDDDAPAAYTPDR